MTIEEMKARKHELGYSNELLAQLSGVPFGTVQKIFSGQTKSPRHSTILALEKVLKAEDTSPAASFPVQEKSAREPLGPSATKRQGDYTLDDYYALPDERRVELIDGEFFDMETPSTYHQAILGELYIQFRACLDAHESGCRVFLSPCDVQLDNDEKTMVQPDLFILCRKQDWKRQSIPGAPDFTLEILSDSTRSKDFLLKTYKYKNAGVREYWIVDPKNEIVLIYDFSDDSLIPVSYTFHDTIPVHISEGSCSIDFERIYQNLQT